MLANLHKIQIQIKVSRSTTTTMAVRSRILLCFKTGAVSFGGSSECGRRPLAMNLMLACYRTQKVPTTI
jgi:hypothetical protein